MAGQRYRTRFVAVNTRDQVTMAVIVANRLLGGNAPGLWRSRRGYLIATAEECFAIRHHDCLPITQSLRGGSVLASIKKVKP